MTIEQLKQAWDAARQAAAVTEENFEQEYARHMREGAGSYSSTLIECRIAARAEHRAKRAYFDAKYWDTLGA